MTAPRIRAHRQVLGRFLVAVQNLKTTGTSVHEDTAYAIAHSLVPAIAVEPDDESSQEYAQTFGDDDGAERTLNVFVTAIGSTPLERDTIMLEAEDSVVAASIGEECNYTGTRFIRLDEGAKPIFAARMRFATRYIVDAKRSQQIIR